MAMLVLIDDEFELWFHIALFFNIKQMFFPRTARMMEHDNFTTLVDLERLKHYELEFVFCLL